MAKSQDNRLFKIRHRHTGLYSSGGLYPSWTKIGKTWGSLRTLRSHLSQHIGNEYRKTDTSAWQVVEIEIREVNLLELHEVVTAERMLKILTR